MFVNEKSKRGRLDNVDGDDGADVDDDDDDDDVKLVGLHWERVNYVVFG